VIDAKLTASRGLCREGLEEVITRLKGRANQDLESKKPIPTKGIGLRG
jgi:hypothetical protein